MRFFCNILCYKLIQHRRKPSPTHLRAVLHFQTSRGRVSWIHEDIQPFLLPFLIDFIKSFSCQIYLAAHVEFFWKITIQLKWNVLYCFHIGGDFIALKSITTSNRLNELSLFIKYRNRSAVVFQLGHEFYFIRF